MLDPLDRTASMKKDDEGDFVTENDDAVDRLNSLIGQAKALMADEASRAKQRLEMSYDLHEEFGAMSS
jgi:hypothetical protein